MVMHIALTWQGWSGAVVIYVIFAFWAVLTISILSKFYLSFEKHAIKYYSTQALVKC
jgi:hypothetical protein